MTIKIVFPEGQGFKPVWGTKLYTESGEEIEGVTRIEMDLSSDDLLQATITVAVSQVENLEVHPLLSMDTLKEAAKIYGYDLVKSNDGD